MSASYCWVWVHPGMCWDDAVTLNWRKWISLPQQASTANSFLVRAVSSLSRCWDFDWFGLARDVILLVSSPHVYHCPWSSSKPSTTCGSYLLLYTDPWALQEGRESLDTDSQPGMSALKSLCELPCASLLDKWTTLQGRLMPRNSWPIQNGLVCVGVGGVGGCCCWLSLGVILLLCFFSRVEVGFPIGPMTSLVSGSWLPQQCQCLLSGVVFMSVHVSFTDHC